MRTAGYRRHPTRGWRNWLALALKLRLSLGRPEYHKASNRTMKPWLLSESSLLPISTTSFSMNGSVFSERFKNHRSYFAQVLFGSAQATAHSACTSTIAGKCFVTLGEIGLLLTVARSVMEMLPCRLAREP